MNMASSSDSSCKDEIKTHFVTREGAYKLMSLSEYSRPTRIAHNGVGNTTVKVSFIDLIDPGNDPSGAGSRICFNFGREIFYYHYKGVKKAADLTKPIDKRIYKGTFPTCHDFNVLTAKEDSVLLLIGFSLGQIQLVDPETRDYHKLFNEDRLIDRSRVSCIKWIPGSPNQFLVSFTSGQLYTINEELPPITTTPSYQMFKHGDSFSVHTCKAKSTRNPLYRWSIGEGSINEFAFSPCSKYLAVVNEDGYLRVFDFNAMELVGTMRSFFGGLLSCAWSPDSKYIVTGGQDDLVTIWSLHEKRVICRGKGHKSWISAVAFDPYTTKFGDADGFDFSGSDEEFQIPRHNNNDDALSRENFRVSLRSNTSQGSRNSNDSITNYRFGSVGQDTHLCLWDLTEDILNQPMGRHRTSTVITTPPKLIRNTHHANNTTTTTTTTSNARSSSIQPSWKDTSQLNVDTLPNPKSHNTSFTQKFATLALGERGHKDGKDHKRNFSLGGKSNDKSPSSMKAQHQARQLDESVRLLGTYTCPRLDEVPMLEPMVCKKVANERLTSLVFREECIVTACHDGFVNTWARPGKANLAHPVSSPQQQQQHGGSTAL